MFTGWWKVSSSEELSRIVSACHPRGIRERVLQKQIQKQMEYLSQVCAKNKDGKPCTSLIIKMPIVIVKNISRAVIATFKT